MEAGLRAQAAATCPSSRRGYLAHWRAWAREGTRGENRTEAVRKMTECLDSNRRDSGLHLRFLGLTSLPEHLPPGLTELSFNYNQSTCPLENLLASPATIDLSNNQLTSLPENITTRFGSNCNIDLTGNPLPERVRSNLHAAMNAPNYHGPRIHFSMAGFARNQVVTPLPEAVACWYAPADQAAATQQWSAFSNEPHAQDFSNFLSRLHSTVNSDSPQFKRNIAEWLAHLADHPSLRNDSFVISQDASTSCEDRVSLSLNTMKNARLTADVERGDYDDRLPELMTLAKGMFRLDQLEGIARQKVASLHFVDEIEVHLAYQVKLREPLALPVATADMRFFNVSYVSEQDLTDATAQVQTAEREHFPDFLASQWQPWQSVLQRLAPERHAQTQDQLIEAMGEPFEQRLQQRLQADGLQNDPDARRQMGPQVTADINREIKLPMTRDFLAERGLLSHIE